GSWTLRAIRELSMPLEAPFANIEAVLDRAAARKDIHETINRLKDQACQYSGEAGRRSADAICAMMH
ncbi:MAG: CDP-glycerol--glycerophosphate glycerophosphotransferase, partial [Spirochaetaceae bacterium]|nr:CDP-glycerol--glycerophosphate glycerophosphotransferase [Spirochaetaceae bacterium]